MLNSDGKAMHKMSKRNNSIQSLSLLLGNVAYLTKTTATSSSFIINEVRVFGKKKIIIWSLMYKPRQLKSIPM